MKLNKRKCKNCKEVFEKKQPLQYTCSIKCAIEYSSKKEKEKREREWKKRKTSIKSEIKTKSELKKELQTIINKIIRKIDQNFPCISCGAESGQMHAGHLHSIGAHPKMRFEPFNIWKQCQICNNHLSGNLLEYRKKLNELFGESVLSDLRHEINSDNTTLTDTKENLREAIKTTRKEIKTLEPAKSNRERIEKRTKIKEILNNY